MKDAKQEGAWEVEAAGKISGKQVETGKIRAGKLDARQVEVRMMVLKQEEAWEVEVTGKIDRK